MSKGSVWDGSAGSRTVPLAPPRLDRLREERFFALSLSVSHFTYKMVNKHRGKLPRMVMSLS